MKAESDVAVSLSGAVDRTKTPVDPLAVTNPLMFVNVWPLYGDKNLLPLICEMLNAAAERVSKALATLQRRPFMTALLDGTRLDGR